MHILVDHSWEYATCENCRKNSHEEIKMVKEKIFGVDVWVCSKCGATKKF